MAKDVFGVLRGELYWAKIVGKAQPHSGLPKYDKGPYWSVDLVPDAKSRAWLKEHGLTEKLKKPKPSDKETRTETFLQFRILENRADGSKNDPPKITDVQNRPWDGAKIGNGSIGDIEVKMKDYGAGSEKGLYYQSARVLKHIPFEGGGLPPLSEDDEYFVASQETSQDEPDTSGESPNPDDLDDDIPF